MWVQALWCFARADACPVQHISELLRNIEEQRVLPPLMVLEILSNSSTVTLSVVRDYLLRWLNTENEGIKSDEALIDDYKHQVQETELLISDVKLNGQVFQVSKCSACDQTLEVQTVHFLFAPMVSRMETKPPRQAIVKQTIPARRAKPKQLSMPQKPPTLKGPPHKQIRTVPKTAWQSEVAQPKPTTGWKAQRKKKIMPNPTQNDTKIPQQSSIPKSTSNYSHKPTSESTHPCDKPEGN